jgi:hypothetical protein
MVWNVECRWLSKAAINIISTLGSIYHWVYSSQGHQQIVGWIHRKVDQLRIDSYLIDFSPGQFIAWLIHRRVNSPQDYLITGLIHRSVNSLKVYSSQGWFILGRFMTGSTHRRVKSLQGQFIVGRFIFGQFITGSIHRRVNSWHGRVIARRLIHCKVDSLWIDSYLVDLSLSSQSHLTTGSIKHKVNLLQGQFIEGIFITGLIYLESIYHWVNSLQSQFIAESTHCKVKLLWVDSYLVDLSLGQFIAELIPRRSIAGWVIVRSINHKVD